MAEKKKHPGGRPLKYTPEELGKKFEEYKASRKGLKKIVYDAKQKTTKEIVYDMPLTLVSFCVFAGIHRDTLNNYKNDYSEFFDIVKKIYQECESDLIDKALTFESHADFAKHILCNAHGYTNRQELDLGNKDGRPFAIETMTPEQRQARIRELMSKMGKNPPHEDKN